MLPVGSTVTKRSFGFAFRTGQASMAGFCRSSISPAVSAEMAAVGPRIERSSAATVYRHFSAKPGERGAREGCRITTVRQKMRDGELHDPMDPELVQASVARMQLRWRWWPT